MSFSTSLCSVWKDLQLGACEARSSLVKEVEEIESGHFSLFAPKKPTNGLDPIKLAD